MSDASRRASSHEYSSIVTIPTPDVDAAIAGTGGVPHSLHQSHPGTSRRTIRQQSDGGILSQSAPSRPQMQRQQSQMQQALAGSARFMGISSDVEEVQRERSRWDKRRLRFLSRKYKLNDEELNKAAAATEPIGGGTQMHSFTPTTPISTDSHMINGIEQPSASSSLVAPARSSTSMESRSRHVPEKESVIKTFVGYAASFLKRGTTVRKSRHVPLVVLKSFDVDVGSEDRGEGTSPLSPGSFLAQRGTRIEHDTSQDLAGRSSCAIIPEESSTEVEDWKSRGGSVRQPNEVPSKDNLPQFQSESDVRPSMFSSQSDDVFDFPVSAMARRSFGDTIQTADAKDLGERPIAPPFLPTTEPAGITRLDLGDPSLNRRQKRVDLGGRGGRVHVGEPDRVLTRDARPRLQKQRSIDFEHPDGEKRKETDEGKPEKRIMDSVLDSLTLPGVLPRRAPRTRGIGCMGNLFQRELGKRKVEQLPEPIRRKIIEGDDERPFFTYWVTTIQVLICFFAIFAYGFGAFGMERVERKREVMDTSSSFRQVSFFEPANAFFGPTIANLILLGAKYSPCMRRERVMWDQIARDRERENRTGCCVFNDRSGCYQTGQTSCPSSIATWIKWHPQRRRVLQKSKSDSDLLRHRNITSMSEPFSDHLHWSPVASLSQRTAGAVCGQDPLWCKRPPSIEPHQWADDLTQWPICEELQEGVALPAHMTCQVTGRPCCIQLQGQCRIATKEYCMFVQGHWHENATLCSQVDCFSNICGMLPFLNKNHPNQFYRLFTSIFLHAGLIHCAISVVVQLWVMRDLERMIGWQRMAILYIGSGIGGNLASAIFVPYNQETGPSGSQLGIFAALLVDLVHHRRVIKKWKRELLFYAAFIFVLFMTGLLPWIDNWAHLFGFIFGLLITMAIFPYLDFSDPETRNTEKLSWTRKIISKRRFLVCSSAIGCLLLFTLLLYIFYANIELDWPIFEYFNCINIRALTRSDHFCDNKGHRLSQLLPI